MTTVETARVVRAWIEGDRDEEVPLPIKIDNRAIFIETGTGVVEVYVDRGALRVCNGEPGDDVQIRPESTNAILVSVFRRA